MDFDAFYIELEEQLQALIKKRFNIHRKAAQADVAEYLRLSKGRLQDYIRLLEVKKITPEEHDFLVQALKQNALLFAMKESGRNLMALKRFAEAMVTVTIEVALTFAIKAI